MAKFRYGLKSIIISDIAADGVTPENPQEVIQYVYKKTLEIIEAEGNITKHYAEGFTTPSIALKETGENIGKVSLFGVPMGLLARLKGGLVTVLDGKATYEKPTQEVQIEQQVVFVTKDDVQYTFKRAFVDAVREDKMNDSDVGMVKVTFIPLLPVDGSSPEEIKEL